MLTKNPPPPPESVWAESTRKLVGAAAKKIWRFRKEYLDHIEVYPTQPFRVYLPTEPIPIRNQPFDPWDYPDQRKKFDKLVETLSKDMFVKDAWWDSASRRRIVVIIEPLIVS